MEYEPYLYETDFLICSLLIYQVYVRLYTMQFQNDALNLPLQQTKTKGFVYTVYIYFFS